MQGGREDVGGVEIMNDPMMAQETKQLQQEALAAAAPLQAALRKALFDLPLTMFSESIRFVGQRMQAHSDFLEHLRTCQSVPEVIEAQSIFVRETVDQYGAETNKIVSEVRETMNKAA
jgi:hypothetical protein